MSDRTETRTGGRIATTRHIFGNFALSVGKPNAIAPPGWRWVALTDVARLESGHTPSRRHPEYWGGNIPWIGIRDAKAHHGELIHETIQTTNELGIQNSSARILPEGTVCLSRTASVGYVVTMGRPMATSQDFANWICSDQIDRRFLAYLLLAEQESLLRFSSGAIHQTIYYPELKALHVCLPSPVEQRRIVAVLDEALVGLKIANANAIKNLKSARELFEIQLAQVFARTAETHGERRLGDIVSRLTNGYVGPTRDIYLKSGIPYLLARHVRDNHLQFDGRTFVSEEFNERHKKSKLKSGDILLVQSGHIGHSAVVGPNHDGHNCHAMIVMSPTAELSGNFLSLFFGSPFMKRKFEEIRSGSTVPHLTCGLVKELLIPLPSIDEQNLLVTNLNKLHAETEILASLADAKLCSLEELKQSILRRAFSGELTSSPIDATQEAAE